MSCLPSLPKPTRGTLVAPARLLTNETGQLLVPVIDKILSASRGRTQAVDIASAPQHPARAWEVSSWRIHRQCAAPGSLQKLQVPSEVGRAIYRWHLQGERAASQHGRRRAS